MASVLDWISVRDRFEFGEKDLLVLGNGASIALNQKFRYESLLRQALDAGHLSHPAQAIFNHLETQDFELVLNMLWHTNTVNQILGVKEQITEETYSLVRNALVESVRENHAVHSEVLQYLPRIGQFMSEYRTVVSVNYDLIVYWAMMAWNREHGNWFKDAFLGDGLFEHEWASFMRERYNADGVTMVFYPHGSLVLSSDVYGTEKKISREWAFDDLLHRVTQSWVEGEHLPLFVSEGSSDQKLTAIRRSNYLSSVYNNVLPERHDNIIFMGFGFGDEDDHLLSQLAKARPEQVAASVFRQKDGRDRERAAHFDAKLARFFDTDHIVLFDATSKGVWIH